MSSLATQLEQLENAQLVRRAPDEDVSYLFKHALTQEAAYESLLLKKRRELHHLVAQAYEQLFHDELDEHAALMAQHFTKAGDDAKAARYHIRAGDASARVFAAIEARFYYTSALAILQGLPESPDTLRTRFEAMVKYATLALAAEETPALFARLLEAEALGARLVGENNPSDRLNLARLRYEIARVHFTLNEPFKAFAYCDLIIDDAQALGDEGLYAWAVGLKSVGKVDQGDFGKAIVGFPPALNYLESTGNWRDWAWMCMNFAFALAEHGEYHDALELGTRVRQRADETQDYWMRCVTALYHSIIYWAGGDTPKSLASAHMLMQLAVEGRELVFVQLGSLPQMLAESKMGDHAAAMRTLAQRQALIERVGVEIVWADWAAAARAEMALNAGETAEAIKRAEYAVKLAQSVGGIFAEGLAKRTWAQALGINQAEAYFADSLQLFDTGEARLEAARTHAAWGKVLHARGDAEAAHEHFQKAAAKFQASGLTGELEQIRSLLDSIPI